MRNGHKARSKHGQPQVHKRVHTYGGMYGHTSRGGPCSANYPIFL